MSRSKHRPKFRDHYAYETTAARRRTMKKWKAQVRKLLRTGRYDLLPLPKKGTEGWETW